jgi:putative sigma-54 modulation protein
MNPRNPGPDVIGGPPPRGFQVDVRTQGFVLTPSIYQHAVDHIAAKLAKHARALSGLTIRLADINGPKHGPDKRCRVEVLLAGSPPVIVEETDQDAAAAMDRAGHRADHLVTRVLQERWSKRRQRGRKMVRNRKLLHLA